MDRLGIIATDLDRTFTDTRLRLVPQALQTMRRVRATGVRTILATGRTLTELRLKRGLLELFDGLIVEGGALFGTPQRLRPNGVVGDAISDLRAWLDEEGIFHVCGTASISISRADLVAVQKYPAIRRFQGVPNRNRADLTLRGVDKGSALQKLRSVLAPKARVLAFGDGENDVRLFQQADWAVAVQNAVPDLLPYADAVTRYPGGRGVAAYLREHVLLELDSDHRAIKAPVRMSRPWTRSSNSRTSRRRSASETAASSRQSKASA